MVEGFQSNEETASLSQCSEVMCDESRSYQTSKGHTGNLCGSKWKIRTWTTGNYDDTWILWAEEGWTSQRGLFGLHRASIPVTHLVLVRILTLVQQFPALQSKFTVGEWVHCTLNGFFFALQWIKAMRDLHFHSLCRCFYTAAQHPSYTACQRTPDRHYY